MSMIPSFRGTFDADMSIEDCRTAAQLIREIKGVASVSFNEKARALSVSYLDPNVVSEARKIDGLKIDTRHRF